MTTVVKNFIKKQKSLIENNNWKYFFTLWNSFGDDLHFEELLNVFRDADIPIDKYLLEVRSDIIYLNFDSMLWIRQNQERVNFDHFYNNFGAHLNATDEEMYEIFSKVAEKYDYVKKAIGGIRRINIR